MAIAAPPAKPLVLISSTPVSGHIIPMIAIARQLVDRGYDVCFASGSGYRKQVEAVGASFVSVEGYGDFYDLTSWDLDQDCKLSDLFFLKYQQEKPFCFCFIYLHYSN